MQYPHILATGRDRTDILLVSISFLIHHVFPQYILVTSKSLLWDGYYLKKQTSNSETVLSFTPFWVISVQTCTWESSSLGRLSLPKPVWSLSIIYQSPGLVIYCKADALKVLLKGREVQFGSEDLWCDESLGWNCISVLQITIQSLRESADGSTADCWKWAKAIGERPYWH